jgi:saccharopine dehydrogenase-like NADP-dependent oxidoreductase
MVPWFTHELLKICDDWFEHSTQSRLFQIHHLDIYCTRENEYDSFESTWWHNAIFIALFERVVKIVKQNVWRKLNYLTTEARKQRNL